MKIRVVMQCLLILIGIFLGTIWAMEPEQPSKRRKMDEGPTVKKEVNSLKDIAAESVKEHLLSGQLSTKNLLLTFGKAPAEQKNKVLSNDDFLIQILNAVAQDSQREVDVVLKLGKAVKYLRNPYIRLFEKSLSQATSTIDEIKNILYKLQPGNEPQKEPFQELFSRYQLAVNNLIKILSFADIKAANASNIVKLLKIPNSELTTLAEEFISEELEQSMAFDVGAVIYDNGLEAKKLLDQALPYFSLILKDQATKTQIYFIRELLNLVGELLWTNWSLTTFIREEKMAVRAALYSENVEALIEILHEFSQGKLDNEAKKKFKALVERLSVQLGSWK